jgi:hypothetical protein
MSRFPIRTLVVLAALLAAILASSQGTSAGPAASSIARISWLGGCWESADPSRGIEEQWMRPRGGTMLGMSRTVREGRTREFEHMRIEERDGRLVFTSKPSGQDEASFDSIEVTSSSIAFENAAHDFPQRIIYRRNADGTLLARIEGTRTGEVRGVDFPMRQTACAGEGK